MAITSATIAGTYVLRTVNDNGRVTGKPRLDALTGLRFFAAFQVLLFHTVHPWLAQGHGVPLWIRNILGSGYTGVNFFFLLSGFILAYNYLDENGARTCSKAEFWAARFARVYPVYLFCLLLAMPLFIGQIGSLFLVPATRVLAGIANGLSSLFLVQAWVPFPGLYVNPPGWSLANEAVFYFLFPLLALMIKPLRVKGLAVVASLSWLACLFFPIVYLSLLPDGPGPITSTTEGVWLSVLKFNPLIHLAEFFFGVAVGRIYIARRRLPFRFSGAVSCGATAAILLLLASSDRIPYPVLHNGLLCPLFAVLIFALSYGKGPVAFFVSLPAVVVLGEASYSLYLLHIPVYLYLGKVVTSLNIALLTKLFFFAAPLFIIGCSIVVFKTVEFPARQALRKWFRNRIVKKVVSG
jgi:peptidoglycan/LPS O-acetylase OafA/YrhL